MASLWFWIVTALIATYIVLDGVDLGAGAAYLFVAKTNDERRRVLRAIGPVWDGNELWLVAAAASLCFAFPRLYTSISDGFRLPLIIVVALLILRAVLIEIRRHIDNPASQNFFDLIFSVCSILLAICFGAGLGNVVRGVPLDANGHFYEPLWTGFHLSQNTGLLDWYTVLTSIMALVTITTHGCYYVALKTEEDMGRRARGLALLFWPVQFFLTFSGLVTTYFVRPGVIDNYHRHNIGYLIPVVVVASLGVMLWANPKEKARLAFIASSFYIAVLLAGVAFALYPVLLPARDYVHDLTIYNASKQGLSNPVSLVVFVAVLVVAGVVFIYRASGGKVQLQDKHER
jgi:cytochrome d ubiquinol oxidase subunit II